MKSRASAKSVKARLVEEITAAIEAAPGDSPDVMKCRARHPRPIRPVRNVNLQESERGRAWFNRATETGGQLARDGFSRITFKAGSATYEVWNTRETLEGFLARVKRHF